MKKLVIAVLVLMMTALLSAGALAKDYTLARTATVYKKASASSTDLGKMPAGSTVHVVSKKGGWAQIDIDGYTGYVKASLLKKTSSKKLTGSYKTTESVKVYGAPSSKNGSIGKLGKGTTVKVLKIENGWARISWGGTYGYIKLAKLKKL